MMTCMTRYWNQVGTTHIINTYNINTSQVGINTSFLDLGFNNLRKVPNLALRKLVFIVFVMIIMMMINWGYQKPFRLVDKADPAWGKQIFDGILMRAASVFETNICTTWSPLFDGILISLLPSKCF